MLGAQAATTKKDRGMPDAATAKAPAAKAPTSAKKALAQGDGFAEQERSLAPGGAADQARLGAGECGPGTRFGDPAPFVWSLAYTRAQMMEGEHASKGRTAVRDELTVDHVIVDEGNAAQFIYGKHVTVVEAGMDARSTTEPVIWEFGESQAAYQQAKATATRSEGVRNLKERAPSKENKTALVRCG